MKHPIASRHRAQWIASSFFIVGLAIISYINAWWPGILAVVGIALAVRQLLLGHLASCFVILFVFAGAFFSVFYEFQVMWVLPSIFAVGVLYLLYREWADAKSETEAEHDEDHNLEIVEEDEKEK